MTLFTPGNNNKLSDAEKSSGRVLNSAHLEQVVSILYLWVHGDQHLKWDAHVLNLCKKISQMLAVLCRIRKDLSRSMLSQQYLPCIQPCTGFAISVWGSSFENDRHLKSRLQHRLRHGWNYVRIVTGNFDFIKIRGADLMRELRWQSLDIRCDNSTSTFMYTCISEAASIRLINELFMNVGVNSYPTRTAVQGDVHVPKPNNELYRQSFKYRSVILCIVSWYKECPKN